METSGTGWDSVQLAFSTADGKTIVGHKLQNGTLSITSAPVKAAGYIPLSGVPKSSGRFVKRRR